MLFFTKDIYYGIRGMVFLAEKGCSSIQEVSEKEGIPAFFLEKIFQKLKKSKIINSKRGAGGGYFLTLPPSKITLKKVIESLKKEYSPVPCLDSSQKTHCPSFNSCRVKKTWKNVSDSFDKNLEKVSLNHFLK